MDSETLPLAHLSAPAIVLLAILFNLLFCSTTRIARIFSLPQTFASSMIATLEARYNRPHATDSMRRWDSLSIAVLLILTGLMLGLGADLVLRELPYAWLLIAMIIGTILSVRVALERNRVLRAALDRSEDEARSTLTYLTGRDATRLDQTGITAAGIESLAMAMVQGLLAPLFWFLIGGLPALFIFKLLDTASIMIDERSDNARSFGSSPRLLAGLLLLPVAWLSGPLISLGSLIVRGASCLSMVKAMIGPERYAFKTFSAPVRTLAFGLDVTLGGPICVGSYERAGDLINAKGKEAGKQDLLRARRLYLGLLLLTTLLLAALAYAAREYPIRFPLVYY